MPFAEALRWVVERDPSVSLAPGRWAFVVDAGSDSAAVVRRLNDYRFATQPPRDVELVGGEPSDRSTGRKVAWWTLRCLDATATKASVMVKCFRTGTRGYGLRVDLERRAAQWQIVGSETLYVS